MQITRQTEYAIKTLLELAALPYGEYLSSKLISEHQEIPGDFLKKTIQLLSLAGLVHTQRGTQGGVRLAKPAAEITIADILVAVEGPLAINPCLAPAYQCKNMAQCTVRPILLRAQTALEKELRRETLQDMLEKEHA